MSLKRKLGTASVLNLMDYVLKFGTVLVVSPYLIARLGKDGYGVWVVLTALIGYLDLLDLGLSNTAVRYLGRASAAERGSESVRLYRHFKVLYARIGAVAVAIALLGAAVTPWFVDDPSLQSDARWVLGFGGVAFGGTFFLRIYSALIKSHVQYHRIIIASMARVIVYSALVFVVLAGEASVTRLIMAWLAGIAVEQALLFFQGRKFVPLAEAEAADDLALEQRREIRGFAGKHFLAVMAAALRERIDVQVVGGALNAVAVTHYAVGSRLIMMFVDVMNAVFGGHFLAAFSRIHARDGDEGAAGRLLGTLRFSAHLALAGGVMIFVLGPPFIDRWLGAGFEDSHFVLRLLAPSYALMLMQYPVGPFLGSLNRHGVIATVSLVGAVFNLVGSLILVRFAGMPGVVMATAAELGITALLVWPLLAARAAMIPLGSYWRQIILRPMLHLTPAAIAVWWLAKTYPPSTYLELVGHGVIDGFLLLIAIWCTGFSKLERSEVIRVLGFGNRVVANDA